MLKTLLMQWVHHQLQDCSAIAHLLLPPPLCTDLSEPSAQYIGCRLRLHLTIVDLFHSPGRQILIWAGQMFRCGKPADLSKILGLSPRACEPHRVLRAPRLTIGWSSHRTVPSS